MFSYSKLRVFLYLLYQRSVEDQCLKELSIQCYFVFKPIDKMTSRMTSMLYKRVPLAPQTINTDKRRWSNSFIHASRSTVDDVSGGVSAVSAECEDSEFDTQFEQFKKRIFLN